MSHDLIDNLPNEMGDSRGVDGENETDIKAVDHGHLDNDITIVDSNDIHTQYQLPRSVTIDQNNLIFTNDGAIYVMVKPPDHGSVMASVQHLNNNTAYHHQQQPINPGVEEGPVDAAANAPIPPGMPLPDGKRRGGEDGSDTVAALHPHHNKRVKYAPQDDVLAFQPPLPRMSGQHQHPSAMSGATLTAATGRVCPLAIESDEGNLSQYQCLARKQIEVFSATADIAGSTAQGRNRPIEVGQVGIRCRHCYLVPLKERKTGSVYFPTRLDGLYQTAQKMMVNHLIKVCPMLPEDTRKRLIYLKSQKSSDGGGKNYWAQGVRSLGVIETRDGLSFAS